MFKRIFNKSRKQETSTVNKSRKRETSTVTTIQKLNETLKMLEKKENLLVKKASAEMEKAREYAKAKKKTAALQCLKKKKLYENQIGRLSTFQLRIHDQIIMLEGAEATAEMVGALRTGASTMEAMFKTSGIGDLDRTVSEINEQTENMRQIQDALSAPFGPSADFDEDELEAELEELEEADLEAEFLEPATAAPKAPTHVPVGRKAAARPAQVKDAAEEEDLRGLLAELAL